MALRPMLFYAAMLVAGLVIVLIPQSEPDDILAIVRAEYVSLVDIDAPAPPDGGMALDLPHRCVGTAAAAVGCAGHYRIAFRYDGAAGEPWSIYIPTYSSRLKLWVNGTFLTDTRRFRTGAVINQAGPLIAPIPEPMLRVGENRLDIRMESWNSASGFLDRVHVGPDTALRPAYTGRDLLLEGLPKLLVAWQAALALSLLIVWFGRRQEWMHLTMSVVLGFGVLQGLPQFLIGPGWPDWLLRVTNMAGLWQVALLPGLMAQLVGRRQPLRTSRALLLPAFVTLAFLVRTMDPETLQPLFRGLWVVVVLPWAMAMLGLSIWIVADAAFRRDHAAARIIVAAFMAMLPIIGHDVLVFLGALPDQRAFVSRFGASFLMTAISGTLMWRFAMALNEVSRFNANLRREVVAAEEALRASFAREQAQVRATALESERLRLTRDLHDGLAGQLVSMVAQCELRGSDYREIAVSARRALDDLRLVVASLDDVGNDLAMMLALFRERIGPQLQAQGMELDWQMAPLPDVEGLRSEHTLALFRILQEAVTNAVRHSGCRRVTISMAPVPAPDSAPDSAALGEHAVRIVVADRGHGGVAPRAGGHGLGNMRRRAAGMGADLVVETGPGGTRVVIDLPHAFPDIAPVGAPVGGGA